LTIDEFRLLIFELTCGHFFLFPIKNPKSTIVTRQSIPLPLIKAHSSLASLRSRLSARVSKTYQIGILRLCALFPFHVRVPI
jgi:hypothetical protein